MKTKLLTAAALGLGLTILGTAQAAAPKVAEPYQRSIEAAWKQVNQAELPVYECVHVAGTAARLAEDPDQIEEARRAYRVCYVDSAIRFSDAFFKKLHHGELADNGKPYGCTDYNRYLRGHVVSLEAQAERLGFNTSELNSEIQAHISDLAKSCEVQLP